MATVFIWNNHLFRVGKHTWPGHAAMSIDDTWPTQYGDVVESYVSWLPFGVTRSHSGHRHAYPGANIWSDIYFEGYGPDHIIRVDLGDGDVAAMLQYWKAARVKKSVQYLSSVDLDNDFAELQRKYSDLDLDDKMCLKRIGRPDSGPSYRYEWKNCSTMVSNVLKRARRSSSAWPHQLHHLIWTPLDIKHLALALGGKKMTWADFVNNEAGRSLSDEKRTMLLQVRKRQAGMGSSGAFNAFGGGRPLAGKTDMQAFRNRLMC